MRVSEVMTRSPHVVRPQAGLPEAAAAMRQYDIGSLPVVEDGRVVGILTDRDLATRVVAESRDLATSLVDDVMTPAVVHVYEDQELDDAAELMGTWQVRRLPVLDRQQRLVGIVTLGDLAGRDPKAAGRALERISKQTPVPVLG